MSTITIKNLTKDFGKVRALDAVSLTIEENKIYGLLGRNGAGKSTLLNIISNRLFAGEGEIKVDGENSVENDRALSKIYCMSDKDLYEKSLRVSEIFKLTKAYYPDFDMEYANELAEKFHLNTKKKLKGLSTGYTSIYKLILALACNAPIVFFDEPVLGLDANHRDIFYKELMAHYAERPATFVISTHLIEEAAGLIEKVLVLKDGRLILDEDVEKLLRSGYSVTGAEARADEFTKGMEIMGEDALGGLKTVYVKGKRPAEIPDGLEFASLDLQKLFIQLTND